MVRKSLFYKVYFGIVIAFVLLLITALFFLYTFMKRYEAARPKVIAETVCSKYISKGNIWQIKDKYDINISPYETEKSVNLTFKSLVKDKKLELNYTSQIPEGCDICYMVKAGGENYFSIGLVKNKKKDMFGIRGYTVKKVTVEKDIYKTVNLYFPSSAKVTVNGMSLSNDDIKKLPLPTINDFKFDDNAVYPCTAELMYFLSDDVSVKTSSDEFEVEKTDTGYSVSQKLDETLKNEIKDLVYKGAKVYADHMQDDVGIGAMAKYFDTSTDFYKNVRNTLTNFALNHDSASYEDVVCTEYQNYTDTIYSCRLRFTQVLKLRGKIYKDYFDKRIFLRIDKNGKKIIDMQSVAINEE